jgi:hypothetical protein
MEYLKNKRGWLKIFEAFLAVLLIMGFLLITLSRQDVGNNEASEIGKLQRSVLTSIDNDPILRNQVLINDTSGSIIFINKLKPVGFNYSLQVCNPLDICPLNTSSDIIANKQIYANSILITSNLTYYNQRQLKLFFWRI